MNEMIHLGQAITVVITTVATDEDARKLSRELVEQQLAACVQLTPIVSVYSWKGEIEEDREIRLMIKVVEERKIDVVRYLKKNHPYDTPEIILTAFSSDRDYYEWCMSVSGIQKK
ncbi:MAG: divalent-cation tolerance protein CutA [Candidatus Kariarchaeaceae archaeon]